MSLRERVAGTLAVAILGALSLISGLDRATIYEPDLTRLVPDVARADAWKVTAGQALSAGDGPQIETLTRRAIAADPADHRTVGMRGAGLLGSDAEEAARSFAIADRMTARDPLVQAYAFDRALLSGDAAQAADRLDNLLRVHPRLSAIDYFFASLERTGEGRRQLAERLVEDRVWGNAYLSAQGAGDAVLRSRARFLASPDSDLTLGCDRIEPMLRELAVRNFRGEAQALAARHCPERAMAQVVADVGFEAVGADATFGWRRHGSGDVRIVTVGERDKSLELQNRSGVTRLVVSQPVALDAGEYRAFASVSGTRPDSLIASLDCGTPQRPSSASGALARGQLLRAGSCADLVLGIWVRPGGERVVIDNLRLEPVGR